VYDDFFMDGWVLGVIIDPEPAIGISGVDQLDEWAGVNYGLELSLVVLVGPIPLSSFCARTCSSPFSISLS
jgi:hypothetical protein